MSLSRKEFLTRGMLSLGKMLLPPPETEGHTPKQRVIRPPGLNPEKVNACGNCDRCRTACPEGIIARAPGVDGPVLRFGSSGCSFCYLCIGSCPNGVLALPAEALPLRLGTARMGSGCLAGGGCFTCSERCPAGAIEIAWGSGIRIDQERCVGCGACEVCCPVRPSAIRVEPIS